MENNLVVEVKKGNDVYYPKCLRCEITEALPYSINRASMTLENLLGANYFIDVGDEVSVFIDDFKVFRGYISNVNMALNDKNSIRCQCKDIGVFLSYKYNTDNISYSNTCAGSIIYDLNTSYMPASQYNTDRIDKTGTPEIDYMANKYSKKILDAANEVAALSGCQFFVDYDSNMIFRNPPVRENSYKIEEDNTALLNLEYEKDDSDLVNKVTIWSNFSGSNVEATREDAISQSLYGTREMIQMKTNINSSACDYFALANISVYSEPLERISCTLVGNVDIKIGDLVRTTIPSFDIDTPLYVKEIRQSIDENSWTTTLNIGEKPYSNQDIINAIARRLRELSGTEIT